MKEMNRKIGIGFLWNLASLFMTRGASTIFTLMLAYFLTPEVFGFIAMLTVVFELASTIVEGGLGQALIRSKVVSNTDLNTVFCSNLLLSVLSYAVLFWGAPFIAKYYSQPDLVVLIQVMGVVIFFNTFKIVQIAVLSRDMNFKAQMKANMLGVVVSGILAVILAWKGFGVWSLVIQVLSSALTSAIVLCLVCNWRPKLEFSSESFFNLFKFSRNLLLDGVLTVLFQNSYIMVIGRFFSAEVTGLYFLAKKISNLISRQLTGAVTQVTFPALSTLQDDNNLLKKKYREIIQLTIFMVAPVMSLVAGFASPIFELVFNDEWQMAVPYLQVLCIVGILFPLHALSVNLLNIKGRSDLVLKIGIVKKVVNLILLISAIPYGVMGIIISQVLGSVIAIIPNTYFSSRLIGYSLYDQAFDAVKPIVAAALAGFFVWYCVSFHLEEISILYLAFYAFVGLLVYLVVSLIVRAEGVAMLFVFCKKYLGIFLRYDSTIL